MTEQEKRREMDEVEALWRQMAKPTRERLLRQAQLMTGGEESTWVVFKTLSRLARKADSKGDRLWPSFRSEVSKVNESTKRRRNREFLVGDEVEQFRQTVTPEDLVAAKHAVEQLNEGDRQLVELMHQGYDAKEIADQYNTAHAAIRKRIWRLRAKLKGFDVLLGGAVALVAAAGGVVGFADEPLAPLYLGAIACILAGVAILPWALLLRVKAWQWENSFRQRLYEHMAEHGFAVAFTALAGLGVACVCAGYLLELKFLIRLPIAFAITGFMPVSTVYAIGCWKVEAHAMKELNASLHNMRCCYDDTIETVGHTMRGRPKTRTKRDWTLELTSDLPHQVLEVIRTQLESKLHIAVVNANGCLSWSSSPDLESFRATIHAVRDALGANNAPMYRHHLAVLLQ